MNDLSSVGGHTAPTSAEALASGISWAAVTGGAFVSAALSLILLALGVGLGLSSVSPWSNAGVSGSAIGAAAIAWIVAAQIMASGMGGYIAGRLRIKWASIHSHEVYFRDTAHGLLAWSVGVVISAALLASVARSMAGATLAESSALSGGTEAQGGVTGTTDAHDPDAYSIDALFRSDHPSPDRNDPALRAEVSRILTNALAHKELSAADRSYLGELVAARTGLDQPVAEQRTTQVFVAAQDAINVARKGASYVALWLFVALLAGAFCASYAATIGGRQRDNVRTI